MMMMLLLHEFYFFFAAILVHIFILKTERESEKKRTAEGRVSENSMKEFDEVLNAKSKHKIYVHWLLTDVGQLLKLSATLGARVKI